MNTDAVMCIAFTRHRPSCTPLFRTHSSTCGVMFTKSMRAGMLYVRYSVYDFTSDLRICPLQSPRRGITNHSRFPYADDSPPLRHGPETVPLRGARMAPMALLTRIYFNAVFGGL